MRGTGLARFAVGEFTQIGDLRAVVETFDFGGDRLLALSGRQELLDEGLRLVEFDRHVFGFGDLPDHDLLALPPDHQVANTLLCKDGNCLQRQALRRTRIAPDKRRLDAIGFEHGGCL